MTNEKTTIPAEAERRPLPAARRESPKKRKSPSLNNTEKNWRP